uniref:MULE transposase domain-containing protein n=1 Tax=Meloidogyne incognita TaxID=6306 RepID=A0A914LAE5_MELIC
MQAEILSKRGNLKLNHNGFLYLFGKLNCDETLKFWRCEYFGSKDINCKGRIHTGLDNTFFRQINIHTFPASAENVEVKKVVTSLKRRAIDKMETPAVLRATTLENVPTPVLARLPNKAATKKIVKRAKVKENAPPPMPLNIAQLQIPESYQNYQRSEGNEEQFLLADSGIYEDNGQMQRILIFGRASHVNWAKDMIEVFADGTFVISPPLFQQVYAILSKRCDRWVFPVAYVLLTSKSEATYSRMWELIKNIWPEFSPRSISLDFEMASINSIRTGSPQCEIRCCLFHLVRNMKKKLSEFGLMQRYRNDPIFATQSRWITSMAFLPIGDLTPAIIALDRNLMPELQPIMDWFVMNYTGRLLLNGFRTVPMLLLNGFRTVSSY